MTELEELAFAMRGLERKRADNAIDIEGKIRALYAQMENDGVNVVDTGLFPGMNRFLELPRACELRAAIYRMRRVEWSPNKKTLDKMTSVSYNRCHYMTQASF